MSIGRISDYLTGSSTTSGRYLDHNGEKKKEGRSAAATVHEDMKEAQKSRRPPYLHAMLAGGIGGSTGDMLMHSLDTVKTRQQGAPAVIKYETLLRAYSTIFREEGFFRGLYSGVTPAFLGSLPGTVIFFGTYEYSKRNLIDRGCPDSLAYLAGGFIGDLFASVVYVPSEVLKTRLQLQGRHNNPYFRSGYNYRGTLDAARTIVRQEGWSSLFHGYKATLMRDLPFSALQFAFYEQFQKWAKASCEGQDIGITFEILTGGTAGCLAGIITTPLDVVKTRIQTEVRVEEPLPKLKGEIAKSSLAKAKLKSKSPNTASTKQQVRHLYSGTSIGNASRARLISTSSPSTTVTSAATMKLNTESIWEGLKLIFRHEGVQGLFRGVMPRAVWTSVQSGTMLVTYQTILKSINSNVDIDVDL